MTTKPRIDFGKPGDPSGGVEITDEMLSAGAVASREVSTTDEGKRVVRYIALDRLAAAYRAMISAAPNPPAVEGWRPIETAPKDGTRVLAWTVHQNAAYAKDPVGDGWACVSLIRWIDHNGGGWTWDGLAGVHTHWMPLPASPVPPPGVEGE